MSSNGGGDGGGGGAVPGWVFNPADRVLTIVASAVVSGILSIVYAGVDLVQTVNDVYQQALAAAGGSVMWAATRAGDALLVPGERVAAALETVGASSGLAGPVAAMVTVLVVSLVTGVFLSLAARGLGAVL